ncbi:hypothetical protein GCM10010168_70630 [Actinoplanes ianthinogenes]|uniref:Uncharacterized protein n=1 Tax=Actinoplanes ianthinogenes TaxID=122358 RepID=A0ABM7M6X1_9ACTN|nr:hypothetical protein [Actinoplanes ianthinogenes]BCJ47347.1 hypothetical protein Aiant_80040 [Actinoplanes ianthinogenes]GGR41876.1 hypothetical protein GCM10010168_70630 [Actinoplanes ianthinogenes]
MPADLILQTRLDVLKQALEEVTCVIDAMTEQDDRLNAVEDFLSPEGSLAAAENDLSVHIGVIRRRLDGLLGRSATPGTGLPRPNAVTHRPGKDTENVRTQRIEQVRRHLRDADAELKRLGELRDLVYESFQDVRRWSVAGLPVPALRDAHDEYQALLRELGEEPDPWRRFRAEMPRRGHEVLSRYLELLAGMAVRGLPLETEDVSAVPALVRFDLDATLMAAYKALVEHLMGPVPPRLRDDPNRSPLALMSAVGRRHLPLGYPQWSLWALPLVGRRVGKAVAANWAQKNPLTPGQRLLCADRYALHALGPSYLYATVFLEFDPTVEPAAGGKPEWPSDAQRATLLLRQLRANSAGLDTPLRNRLTTVAEQVEKAWRVARVAAGGDEQPVEPGDQDVVDRFDEELARAKVMRNVGYPLDTIAKLHSAAEELMDEEKPVVSMVLRDLMSAMWIARLREPAQARVIHTRAKESASKIPFGPPVPVGRDPLDGGRSWV